MATVYEFYLRDVFKARAFEALCEAFYAVGATFKRKVDMETASAVYAVSRNPKTNWVQLLVDDNAPSLTLTAVEAVINGLCDDNGFMKYGSPSDNIAPIERRRVM